MKLTRLAEGVGELEVYFDSTIPVEEKIIFIRYIHEHLLENARDVSRIRHYVCPHCGTSVGSRDVAMERLQRWLERHAPIDEDSEERLSILDVLGVKIPKRFQSWISRLGAPTIICSQCEKRMQLWDDLEQSFASPEIRRHVRSLRTKSSILLENESNERALVAEVISTVALAGQLSREFPVSQSGVDMEIEFRSDTGEPTGHKVFLQLKLNNLYKREWKDGREVFKIKDQRYIRHWIDQGLPLFLMVRNADGEIH